MLAGTFPSSLGHSATCTPAARRCPGPREQRMRLDAYDGRKPAPTDCSMFRIGTNPPLAGRAAGGFGWRVESWVQSTGLPPNTLPCECSELRAASVSAVKKSPTRDAIARLRDYLVDHISASPGRAMFSPAPQWRADDMGACWPYSNRTATLVGPRPAGE